MCFLKFIAPLSAPQIKDTLCNPYSPQAVTSPQPSSFLEQANKLPPFNKVQLAMLGCLQLLGTNSQLIFNLEEKLSSNQDLLEKTHSLIRKTKAVRKSESDLSTQEVEASESIIAEGLQSSSEALTTQLFGVQGYRYKLVLAQEVSETLYKDRNFKLSVKLLDLATGEVENNGNLINICLSVCDSKGQWISETREGGSFLKGKLESELYHGFGEFAKLSPRDVSRHYTGKTVNLVVYAKPSLLRYSGESSIERRVGFKLIEPLLIKDVSIMAKKRQ